MFMAQHFEEKKKSNAFFLLPEDFNHLIILVSGPVAARRGRSRRGGEIF